MTQNPAPKITSEMKQKLAQMNGLEMVQALGQGLLPVPPMAQLMPFTGLKAESGLVTLTAETDAKFTNILGITHGAWTMNMLDTAMWLAAKTVLANGETCVSQETSVKFTRAIPVTAGEMTIKGQVLTQGRSVITLSGDVVGADGKIYAVGTSTCLVVPEGQ